MKQCIGGVAFKSANDCVERDPDQIMIYCKINKEEDWDDWQNVGYTNPKWEGRRWDTWKKDLDDSWHTTKMKFVFVKEDPRKNCIQLGQIRFFQGKKLEVLKLQERAELKFDPHGNSELGHATVQTEHSHEAGKEIRQNLLLPGEEPWNKWLGNCNESWVTIDFPKGKLYCIGGVAFKSANDCP